MALEHPRFGVIEDDGVGGLRYSERLEVGDQAAELVLRATDARRVPSRALDEASAAAGVLETLDERGREAFVADLSRPSSVVAAWTGERLEELGDDAPDVLTARPSGDLVLDVLRSLVLQTVVVALDEAATGDAFLTLLYALDPDEPEPYLSVAFDLDGERVGIDVVG